MLVTEPGSAYLLYYYFNTPLFKIRKKFFAFWDHIGQSSGVRICLRDYKYEVVLRDHSEVPGLNPGPLA